MINTQITEVENLTREVLENEIIPSSKPVVIRNLNAQWPIVNAYKKSPQAFCDYLKSYSTGKVVPALVGSPTINGSFSYTDDMANFNFVQKDQYFDMVVDSLLLLMSHPAPPAISLQGIDISDVLTGMTNDNPFSLFQHTSTPRFWMGNKVTTRTHFDYQDNLACVVAGTRKFTLFPPDQISNLYIGPLLTTPAGPPISLVDLSNPDYEKFPKFKTALSHAQQATLNPGDAIFIPYLWWHNVESLDKINALINFWAENNYPNKDNSTAYQCLLHSMLTIPNLPKHQRKVWRSFFDHYVFQLDEGSAEHLPKNIEDIVTNLSPDRKENIKKMLANALLDSKT